MSEERSDWQRELEELGHPYVPTEATQKRRDAEIARDVDAMERAEGVAGGSPSHED